jgi:hypothetical protein
LTRLFLASVKVASNGTHQLEFAGRAALAQRVGLDVLVEQLVGVELRLLRRPDSTRTASGDQA